MIKSSILRLFLVVGLFCGTQGLSSVHAEEKGRVQGKPFVIGNRDEPTRSQLLVLAKSFCVAMRRNHAKEDASALRHYFDPSYLKKHNLMEGKMSVRMAPVGAIHNIQVAEDGRTILCVVETAKNAQEAILLRAVVREKELYLLPLKALDAETGAFTPWILRMKL